MAKQLIKDSTVTEELIVPDDIEKLLATHEPAEESNTSAEDSAESIPDEAVNKILVMKNAFKADDDVVDIEIKSLRRKKFRINGDDSKIVELNISDMNIASRLSLAYNRLVSLMNEAFDKFDDIPDKAEELTEEGIDTVISELDRINRNMCEQIDFIFDYPVSDVLLDGGSMWDPIDGMFKFEHIIESLAPLYQNNLDMEFKRMRAKVSAQVKQHKAAVSKFHK